MIANITGPVMDKDETGLVIEVGGIGLHVAVPASLRDQTNVGEVLRLFTHLIVRETELTLYGFETKEERQYFVLLIGVNGVGPRIGLAALSTTNPSTIRRAVFNEQTEIFNRIPGVGKKTAQKIMLHLEGKLSDLDGLEPMAVIDDTDTQVLEALTAMGFSVVEAQSALQMLPKDAPEEVEERLRMALGYFNSP